MEVRRVTIVRPDNTVVIDGKAHQVDCSAIDPAISVLQWNGERQRGHVEYEQDEDAPFVPNDGLDDVDAYASVIAAWDEAELAEQEAINNPPPPVPDPVVERIAKLEAALVAKGLVTRREIDDAVQPQPVRPTNATTDR